MSSLLIFLIFWYNTTIFKTNFISNRTYTIYSDYGKKEFISLKFKCTPLVCVTVPLTKGSRVMVRPPSDRIKFTLSAIRVSSPTLYSFNTDLMNPVEGTSATANAVLIVFGNKNLYRKWVVSPYLPLKNGKFPPLLLYP